MSEQAQVGDTVRLTIEGEVYKGDTTGWLYVRGWHLNRLNTTVEILSRATPPLPSEPGTFWLDKDNADVWLVNPDGVLKMIGQGGAHPERYAPFRQLVLK